VGVILQERNLASLREIDKNTLLPFEAPSVFMKIEPQLSYWLKSYLQTNERVSSCVRFCYNIAHGDFDDSDEFERRKYLRAALSEFVSIEEVIKDDFDGPMPKILSLNDGRLHVLRLLRHANTHGAATNIRKFTRRVVWPGPDEEIEFDYTGYCVVKVENEIKKSDQWSKYSESDFRAMVSWLEEDQENWGIQNSIVRAAEEYVRQLFYKADNNQLQATP
jgi:hypothetical protein